MLDKKAKLITQQISDLLKNTVDMEYIGESVSQLEHSLQCAYFAKKAKASDEVVLACLLHDVGHFCMDEPQEQMDGLGVVNHEKIGADFLKGLHFSSKVSKLVEGHVQAKRYLVAKKGSYAKQLSQASQGTLNFQGGPMNQVEIVEFEKDPLFEEKIQVRKMDELGKKLDFKAPEVDEYYEMIFNHILRQLQELR